MQRIRQYGDVTLGFERLAIMGLSLEGMQPFELNNNAIVCNGEVYGFRKLKKELEKEYTFASDSDCEILLPMYEKYGTEMFAMLDAEYACIIYDAKKDDLIAYKLSVNVVVSRRECLHFTYKSHKVFCFAGKHYLACVSMTVE